MSITKKNNGYTCPGMLRFIARRKECKYWFDVVTTHLTLAEYFQTREKFFNIMMEGIAYWGELSVRQLTGRAVSRRELSGGDLSWGKCPYRDFLWVGNYRGWAAWGGTVLGGNWPGGWDRGKIYHQPVLIFCMYTL